ncbi:PLP-dependent aminotransferase family protein [Lutibaculum baratangense]|uniref:Transcriptional regulator, GntR family domain protein n=1 Tax=Lutibaculum baratangense AMV1 TaxID=631454 RepID=V4RCM1_9HYPH|nr:PLP-dependent aminotransferase family protein [Lutibaculum baratangense]ESR23149.1 Transcriptional regulator, GntR family domain protein [Lutibaculum baratangense AMV1]
MEVPILQEGQVLLDRSSAVPLPEQIYRSLRQAVAEGTLRPGHRLPSSRRLAATLDVSRNTVNAAYDLLKGESIVDITGRSAPIVAARVPPEGEAPRSATSPPPPSLSVRGRLKADDTRGRAWARHPGLLQPGAPATDLFPFELWARCLRRAVMRERSAVLHYDRTGGVPQLREILASYLAAARGVEAEPDQILVVASTQGALSGLAEALCDPGERVWIEDPGYLGARAAFSGAGLALSGLPVDAEGANVERMKSEDAARLIYVTPSHQYPTGARMTLARRLSLLAHARSVGAMVLEDDYDSEFLFEGRPISALHGLAQSEQVIYLGTFAKTLLPGLRTAYCVVPKALARDLTELFRSTGRLANVHAQLAIADFIDGGHYQAHLRRIRTVYEERGSALHRALVSRFGDRIEVDRPTGNVQLTVAFRAPVDDAEVAMAMQRDGFAVSPLSACYLDAAPRPGLVIGFAGATASQIEAGIRSLERALDAQQPRVQPKLTR